MPIFPRPLQKGDTIAIVSPASIIDPTLVERAASSLSSLDYNVKIMPHALSTYGSYAGSIENRLADLTDALLDPTVRAILCSRGGYGCVHLLDAIDSLNIEADPKWLIGFSDVSALHALMSKHNIVSIHGSMAKALALEPLDTPFNSMLLNMLRGERPTLQFPGHKYNRQGTTTGRLVGGNLAVLQALIGTHYDIFNDAILFIEDVAEPIYKIERILYQLRLTGRLSSLKGLIIGQFTLYEADKNFSNIYDMIAPMLYGLNIPIAFDAPIGHIRDNMPLLHGSEVVFSVTSSSQISYL